MYLVLSKCNFFFIIVGGTETNYTKTKTTLN